MGGEGKFTVLGLSVLLLAFALRIHLLGAQSLWNDEGNSYVQATRGFADIAANAARDIHPPGYYWLLKVWMVFTGESEFALRSLSAFASLLSIAVTYALGRRLFSPLAGLAAALFVTLNTFSIYYAQETRMYALLALWGVLGMWALVGFLRQSQVRTGRALSLQSPVMRWGLALALINAAGLWTQYAYPFFMLAQGVIFLIFFVSSLRQKRADGRGLLIYIAANVLTILLYLPWLPGAWAQLTTWPNTGQAIALGDAVGLLLGWFSFGLTYIENDPSWLAIVLLLLAFGLRSRGKQGEWLRILVPVVWVLLPVGLFLAFGLFREANIKLLLPAQIGFALWMGRGLDAIWSLEMPERARFAVIPRLAVAAALAGICLNMWNGLAFLYHDGGYQRDDYRGVVQALAANLRPDDAIILDAPNQAEVFRYYYAAAAPVYPLPAGLGGDDAATQAAVENLIGEHDNLYVVYWGEAERDPNRVVEGTLTSSTYEASSGWYGDVRLVRYATPVDMAVTESAGAEFGEHITLESYALSVQTIQPGDVLQIRLDWRTDESLETRYKVFVQLLDSAGVLVAQRDSEPGGGLALTSTWTPDTIISDQHALLIPNNLAPANYTLIIGLYNINNAEDRLNVGAEDYLVLSEIAVNPE